jgi:hypothetical protein
MALVTVGDEQVTVSTASIGFTSAELTTSVMQASFQVEDASIRFSTTGAAALANGSNGEKTGNVGDVVTVVGSRDIVNFRAIRKGSTDAKLQVSFEGTGEV